MGYRPRDICSAAFSNDVSRLRLLAYQDAPGGLEYRFNAERFLAAVAAHRGNVQSGNPTTSADLAGNDEEDEDEAELTEELEALLDADSELVRLRTLYTLEEEEIDDEDAAAAAEEDAEAGGHAEDDGLYDPDLVEADMAAQEADFARFKRLLRHQLREKAVAELLQRPGLLISGDSAAELDSFGFLFTAKEERESRGSDSVPDGASHVTPLSVRWLPVRGCPYTASALHWAVLGRAHDAVRFLVANGADVAAEVGRSKPRSDGGQSTPDFPPDLTAERVAKMNRSEETLRVLKAAIADREAFLHSMELARQQVESSLEGRKARQEKRRLAREQRRVAREERNAAAEDDDEEADDGEGDGNDDGNDEGNSAEDATDNDDGEH